MSASCAWPGRAACRPAAGIDADRLSRRHVPDSPRRNVQAVDATNGDLIWEYARDYPKASIRSRGAHKNLGIYQDMIYFAAPDGFLVAIDAKTGKVRWETKVDDGGQHRRRHPGRGRQGAHQPHLRAGHARELLHRGERREDRQGAVEVLHHRGARRARRRHLGNMPVESAPPAPGACPAPTIPSAGSLYWGIANPNPYTRLTRHGGHDAISYSAPANSTATPRSRSTSHRQARLVLPGAAGRRLGCRPQPGAHPAPYAASIPIRGT